MKNYVFLFLFLVLTFNCIIGQVSSNAGLDTTICVTWNTPGNLVLGGNPTANGGTAPYVYTWECNYNYLVGPNTYLLTASDFLSDTNVANPNLIHTVNSPVTFVLTVHDANGQSSVDSIVVSFSLFGTNLAEYNYYILAGDSIQYNLGPNVWGGTPPLSYLWLPNSGLSDSTSENNFWVNPTANTSYYVTVTDAAGCVVSGTPAFHVYVDYLDLAQTKLNDQNEVVLYPNPSSGKVFIINKETDIQAIVVYNVLGEIILIPEKGADGSFNLSELPLGMYQLHLKSDEKTWVKKLIKH